MYSYKKEDGNWTICNMVSQYKGVVGFQYLTDNERAIYGFYPCVVINEGYNPETQSRSSEPLQWDFDEETKVLTATYSIVDKSEETIKVEAINKQIIEAKEYLVATDYKMLTNYVVKPDEDLNGIITKRNKDREFIRANEIKK